MNRRIGKSCLICGKVFYTYVSQNCKFCSRKCAGEARAKKIPDTKLDGNLAYILGVLCGDGCLTKTNKKGDFSIDLRTIDLEFAIAFKSNLEKVYGLRTEIKIKPPQITKIRDKAYECKKQFRVRLYSKKTYEDLLKYDSNGKFKTKTWRVPKQIMDSEDERVICLFLRGFLDSEATPREYCLEVSSSNKGGLDDIEKLLSKIGIKRFHYYKDWKNVWKLIFSGKDNLLIIHKKVGFTIERKQKKLAKSTEYKLKVKGFKKTDYWKALSLRKEGHTYRKISDLLKINPDTVRNWCSRYQIPYEIQRETKLQELKVIKA